MREKLVPVAICIAVFAMSASGQTVTGSGTSGTVPVFNGTSTVTNSPISVSGGNVGIGTTDPPDALSVYSGSGVDGGAFMQIGSMGAYAWQIGRDPSSTYAWGGLVFRNSGGSNSFLDRMIITPGGNVGIGTTSPQSLLDLFMGQLLVRDNDAAPQYGTGMRVGYDGSNSPALGFRVSDQSERFKVAMVGTAIDSPTERLSISGDCGGGCGMTEYLSVNKNGSVGIGTTSPAYALDVAGQIRSSAGGVVYPDGTAQTTAWTGVVCGGDYAESVNVSGSRPSYEAGDVLVIDPSAPGKFLKANQPYSTLVAGIYSTRPGTVGRRQTTPKSPDEVPMAMVGIVPAKVSAENGPIRTGDLLVTSSTLGYAMKGTEPSRLTGAVIGKALGNLNSDTGVIEVLVTLQ